MRTKRGFKHKKKHFSSFSKSFHWSKKKNLYGKWESDFRFALLNLVIQYWVIIRVSCLEVFWKIRVYKRSWGLSGKYLLWSGFRKVAGLETGSTLGVCLKPLLDQKLCRIPGGICFCITTLLNEFHINNTLANLRNNILYLECKDMLLTFHLQ